VQRAAELIERGLVVAAIPRLLPLAEAARGVTAQFQYVHAAQQRDHDADRQHHNQHKLCIHSRSHDYLNA
jgi:hypothetical protein